jgi:hypothetical protein
VRCSIQVAGLGEGWLLGRPRCDSLLPAVQDLPKKVVGLEKELSSCQAASESLRRHAADLEAKLAEAGSLEHSQQERISQLQQELATAQGAIIRNETTCCFCHAQVRHSLAVKMPGALQCVHLCVCFCPAHGISCFVL